MCWVADDSWRARLERSQLAHPPGEPELDHLVGDLGKVANAYRRGDELGLRLAAQDVARSCPSLLQPLNPHPGVGSRHAALLAALGFAVVPPGYHDDLLVCLGLTGRQTSAAEVYGAACRLATGVVELLGRTRTGSPGRCHGRWRLPSSMAAYAGTSPNSSGTHPGKTSDHYESLRVGWRRRPHVLTFP